MNIDEIVESMPKVSPFNPPCAGDIYPVGKRHVDYYDSKFSREFEKEGKMP